MNEFAKLHEFINLAQKNRKYPANTAHGRRAALKLFETVLHADELESLDLIDERIQEIYLSLISKHKDTFSIKSLNTYRGRFLKVIYDYKKYGADPSAIATWEVKQRRHEKKSISPNKIEDIELSSVSLPIHRHVYKVQISLDNGSNFSMELPEKITKKDASIITKIIESLTE